MVKGGLLKVRVWYSRRMIPICRSLERVQYVLLLTQGQQFLVLGAAGALPQAPAQPVQFLEDLKGDALAQAVRHPTYQSENKVGLVNLGNTCYLNSTLQVLRCIPELSEALTAYTGSMSREGDAALVAPLRDLFREMNKAPDAFPPLVFLSALRKVAPQFAEMAEGGGGFAQQDAEEVYVRILNALGNYLAMPNGTDRFVPQYLTGHMAIEYVALAYQTLESRSDRRGADACE